MFNLEHDQSYVNPHSSTYVTPKLISCVSKVINESIKIFGTHLPVSKTVSLPAHNVNKVELCKSLWPSSKQGQHAYHALKSPVSPNHVGGNNKNEMN